MVEGNARDPGGEAAWAVRRYTGRTGLQCFEAGQVVSGRFGRVHGGRFYESPDDEPTGACGDLADATETPDGVLIGIHRRFDGHKTADRSVVYGLATRGVTSVTVDGPGGQRRVLVGPKGTFVTAYAGDLTFGDIQVSYGYSDGSAKTLRPIGRTS
jgi:hypothetical protein